MATQPPPENNAEQANAPPNAAQQPEEETGYAPLVDPRLPTHKDVSLKEFLSKMDDCAPIVCRASLYSPLIHDLYQGAH